MLTNLAAAAWSHGPAGWGGGWGPHMYGHGGGPGWWLIFPIGFLLFLFGILAVATLWVVRRTAPPQPRQRPYESEPPTDTR